MEITAAYREPKIKTYGFQQKTALALVEVHAPMEDLAAMGENLCRLGELGVDFHLAIGHNAEDRSLRSYLLIPREVEGLLTKHFESLSGPQARLSGRIICPAELVFFQGPHYGDRFGILHATLQALDSGGLRVLAAACSLSCISIVVPEGTSQEVVSALSQVFEIPRPSRARRKDPAVDLGED